MAGEKESRRDWLHRKVPYLGEDVANIIRLGKLVYSNPNLRPPALPGSRGLGVTEESQQPSQAASVATPRRGHIAT